MKRIAFCLSSVMVLSLSSFARGEETNAEETLKSFGEFMVAGVWKTEVENFSISIFSNLARRRPTFTCQLQLSWFGNNRFIRASTTVDGKPDDSVVVIGVDPQTKKVSSWEFSPQGFAMGTMTQQVEGMWICKSPLNAGGNENAVTMKWVRVGQDECSLELFFVAKDGAEQSVFPVPLVWKRHKA